MRGRNLVVLLLLLSGCQSPEGYPGPLARAYDYIRYPNQTHCHVRKLSAGTRYLDDYPEKVWVEIGKDGKAHRLIPNAKDGVPERQPYEPANRPFTSS